MKLLILIFVVLNISCVENEQCREKTDIKLRAGILNFATNSSLTIDSLTVRAIDSDSLLFNNRRNIQNIILPLKKHDDLSIFVVRFNATTDTISIYHTNRDFFISFACGIVITHYIDTILTTNHFIKEIKITERNVNTLPVQNIQILR